MFVDHNTVNYCMNEYNILKKVIVCEPQYMEIREVINETQKQYKNENIDRELAMQQHKQFIEQLEDLDVKVYQLPARAKFPEQVFTRDIGFTIGKTVFVAEMANHLRQGEDKVLKSWLEEAEVPFYDLTMAHIEGGDVLIDRKSIYIGVSSRTDEKSIVQLQNLLPHFEIIALPFNNKFLHLDCVFNIISETEALFFPEAFAKEEIDLLHSRYDLIEINDCEQFTLGTNVLSIGRKKIISLTGNKGVNNQLRTRGYEVIEVDMSEIIKSGGSFRCCTMPLVRE
ncbi:dimethylarginine dimethylaminohydrolase family protein [Peribacillus huizhouensis]|uniref:N-dimethylarginine dimethylaminohydrolase n=1 Tax=Peribacillus huizhouensis TaxID=1501239 RepID=A0ABR6CJS3_9BACI|nr:dimethylarginine dimethylaminohydrolase family protein [Peribacillus huizhouensis]MBA9025280.1 N-dimethylarginine dimethylaminohydrolase [Peribacillus huizhouensis]